MLDFDLAEFYGVETKYLKRTVRRNIERFPEDFMFELTIEEYNSLIMSLRCQFGTSNEAGEKGGIRYLPFAFTQEGIAMLSGILRSERAIEVNICIMRAFVLMRQMVIGYEELLQRIEQLEISTNTQFLDIYQALTELLSKKKIDETPRRPIGYKRAGAPTS